MQTLQAGAFLNLDSDEKVEALKFTARLLAEHSGTVVKEQLSRATLENLVNNLWQKAEYVARDTERRRLQQIFVENFTERFRELKPGVDTLTDETADSFNREVAPEKVEVKREEAIFQPNTVPAEHIPEAGAQQDEFLGLVKPGESVDDTATEDREVSTSASEENKQTAAESEALTNSETIKSENETGAPKPAASEIDKVSQAAETVQENIKADKLQTTAQNNSRTIDQVKSEAPSSAAKEPFEFGKCTVSLNLVLLPCSGAEASRKAIISSASHHLPPEIEFLEIETGEDLDQIAALVKDKLRRFRATMPVKYIEQLRASKAKTTKTYQTAKSVLPASPPTANSQKTEEKTSGEQKTIIQTEDIKPEQTAEKTGENALSAGAVTASAPANDRVQPSLF